MIALMLLSTAIIMSLIVMEQARRVTVLATEVRRAQSLMTMLLETPPEALEDLSGQATGFTWRLQTRPTGAERPIEICRRSVDLVSASGGRAYQAATQVTCPAADPA
ncbi:hypothetical protein [Phenylobacterium sp.]|uniref:hypothetical protein n=1 Tax=Phenylobacterium sp. TaxID=1871053 RepID=UPI00286E6561|nr:hypothetical protein [Phenylobacterium sp.]